MEAKTTIYLIRHSVRFNNNNILQYNTIQNKTIKNEKIILSVEGEKRAEILSNEQELQNIDVVCASNCVRTLQTAKYLLEKQNLQVNIDERFDERRSGKPNDDIVKDWWVRQYIDENYKTEGGESQKEVRERFEQAFNEVLEANKGKRVAIFAHAYAITFFIMKWCKFEYKRAIGSSIRYNVSDQTNIIPRGENYGSTQYYTGSKRNSTITYRFPSGCFPRDSADRIESYSSGRVF